MDRKGLIKNIATVSFILGVGFFSAYLGMRTYKASRVQTVHDMGGQVEHGTHGKSTTFFATLKEAARDVQEKIEILSRAEDENERLKFENANLRMQLQSTQFECTSNEARLKTEQIGKSLSQQTGARTGRSLASISYKLPSNLLPEQLYALAVTYFKAREDEKAAVILTFLTDRQETDFRTPANILMTGITWYRLDNYEVADTYFEMVMKLPPDAEVLQYQAQARLWRGLAAEKRQNHVKAQFWLKELMDHHPHSSEAGWVNGVGGEQISAASREDAQTREPAAAAETKSAHAVEAKPASHHDEPSKENHGAHH